MELQIPSENTEQTERDWLEGVKDTDPGHRLPARETHPLGLNIWAEKTPETQSLGS